MLSCYAIGGEPSLFNVPVYKYCENSHNVKYTKKGFYLVRILPFTNWKQEYMVNCSATQKTNACSKSTNETLEKGAKYVQG